VNRWLKRFGLGDWSQEETGCKAVLLNNASEFFEVINEATMFEAPGFVIRSAQN